MEISAKVGELMSYNNIKVFTDGGARGNPGHAAIGVHICDDGDVEIKNHSKYIGHATNNIAEYMAVLEAIDLLMTMNFKSVIFYLDSELVVRQMNGEYRVRDPKLKELFLEVKTKLATIDAAYSFTHVRREENKIADALVNCELDKLSS